MASSSVSLECNNIMKNNNTDFDEKISSYDSSDNISICSVSSVEGATCSYYKTYSDTSSDTSCQSMDNHNSEEIHQKDCFTVTCSSDSSLDFGTTDHKEWSSPEKMNDLICQKYPLQFQRLQVILQESDYTYVSKRLGAKLGLNNKTLRDLLFDIVIISTTRAPLLLTFIQGCGRRRKADEYNAKLIRRIVSAVREDTITNFAMVGGVVDTKNCQSKESFQETISDMKTKAYSFTIPGSLDMDETKKKLLMMKFQTLVSVGPAQPSSAATGWREMTSTPYEESGSGPFSLPVTGQVCSGKSSTANTHQVLDTPFDSSLTKPNAGFPNETVQVINNIKTKGREYTSSARGTSPVKYGTDSDQNSEEKITTNFDKLNGHAVHVKQKLNRGLQSVKEKCRNMANKGRNNMIGDSQAMLGTVPQRDLRLN